MIEALTESAELLERVFPGDSELARLMRAYDWAASELGPPALWPENLRIALGICLTSKFPMHILWGPSLTLLYNDAYVSFLGPGKHPAVLGRSGREAWAEIWSTVGPMVDLVVATKQASWSADIPMFFERALPKEEVYVTFSLSPLLGPTGVDGLFCACTESTQQIVGSRRLEVLCTLGSRATTARSIAAACNMAADVLGNAAHDVPFAAIYVVDAAGTAVLRASTGLPPDHSLPRTAAPHEPSGASWPICDVTRHPRVHVIDDLSSLGLHVPAGPWPEPTRSAVVLPISSKTPDKPAGVLVVGVSPRRVFDAEYQSFFELVAEHIATVIADAQAHEAERTPTEVLAEREGSAHLPEQQLASAQMQTSAASLAFVEEAARWAPQPSASPTPFAAAAPSGAPRARILVVDDNADIRSYLLRVLSEHWVVRGAANGIAALDALRKSRFDLVLTDLMMPECDGFELIRALRADVRLAALPVIVISGRAGEEERIQGLEHGADDYLTKPFSAREIVTRVASHLKLSTLRGEVLSSRAKDEFLAILSHELRNPLAPIATAVSMLRMQGAESRELDVIERQAHHLRRLVDDLLDVAQIEAGKVELRTEFVELGSIVSSAIEMVRGQVEARRQVLDVRVPPGGLAVLGDPARLAQVLSNLIVNAGKYSAPESQIEIEGSASDGVARVVVRDRGIGLAPEMRSRVFNLFVQQSQAIDRKLGGLGLGLAIARGLVELHGGSLRAASEGLGRGAELIVELPLADPQHARSLEELAAASGEPGPSHEPHRVLVVDDNTDSADLLASALTRFGYSVATAYDGVDGLSTADTFQPDVCLLDIGLPRMDGYELARQLRDSGKLPSGLRLIAITGYGQAADRRRAAEAGFDAHLTKPVDLENLLGLLSPAPQ